MTLRELGETRQESGHLRRRWFSSPQCDLIVWLDQDDSLWGFQLCYDKLSKEHALTWIRDAGVSHMAVDAGGRDGKGKGTPFLVADGVFDARHVLNAFEREAVSIPPDYRDFIAGKLRELG